MSRPPVSQGNYAIIRKNQQQTGMCQVRRYSRENNEFEVQEKIMNLQFSDQKDPEIQKSL